MENLHPTTKYPQKIYIYYAIWRFRTTKNFADAINQEISAIIALYNSNTFDDPIDRTNWLLLRQVIKAIRRQPGRSKRHTNPIRNLLLLKMIKKYKKFSYHNLIYKAMICFGKNFALRCGEYTPTSQTPKHNTLRWKYLYFHRHKGIKSLTLKLYSTKTNKTWKEELITRQCLCSNPKLKPICAVCHMAKLKNYCIKHFGDGPEDFIFKNPNGSLITGTIYRNEFKDALAFVGIKAKFPYWRVHSLRYGEISDLAAAGVDLNYIKQYARHSPKSQTTFHYIQLHTDEEASIVTKKYLLYFNK